MLRAYVSLLIARLLRGQCLQLVLTPLPAPEQLAMMMLVPALCRWRTSREWN